MSHQERGPQCFFFLSYAHEDQDDWVQRFYKDLSDEVRAYAALPRGTEVGFLDAQSLDLGASWSDRLMRDLARCTTFVALVSPRYIHSQWCGREWAVFADRLSRHTAQDGQPAALLPLLWRLVPALPPVVQTYQYQDSQLPTDYPDKGLLTLMKLSRYEDAYIEFVEVLAQKIVRNAKADQVPRLTTVPAFEQVTSVFHPAAGEATTGRRGNPALAGSAGSDNHHAGRVTPSALAVGDHLATANDRDPQIPTMPIPAPAEATPPAQAVPASAMDSKGQPICFVVAAPALADLRSEVLASLDREQRFYGRTAADWKPYLPELTMPLAAYARQIAEQQQFDAVVTDLTQLRSMVAAARSVDQPVILLVDLWVVYLDEPRLLLERYDRRRPFGDWPVTAVLVPANTADEQTRTRHNELVTTLREVIGDRLRNTGAAISRTGIPSYRQFRDDLLEALEKVRNDAFRTRHPHHRPPGRPSPRPILQGP